MNKGEIEIGEPNLDPKAAGRVGSEMAHLQRFGDAYATKIESKAKKTQTLEENIKKVEKQIYT